jgi:hypothetical protein
MTTLRHVLWIGGASASGKTTLARRLARKHGLRWYSADKRTWAHRDVALAAGHEGAARWEAMTLEEREATLVASPVDLTKLNLDFERGPMIVDDLLRLPPAPLVIADGATVLPELVADGHAEPDRAMWLLPSFELLRSRHVKRGMAHFVEYRWLVAQEIERQAVELGVNVLPVDETLGTDDALTAVEDLFAGALAEGPCAETLEDRQALLRWANEEVVTQVRSYLARPWTTGDEATFEQDFLCECGNPECAEIVEVTVADYAPGVSAHGRQRLPSRGPCCGSLRSGCLP